MVYSQHLRRELDKGYLIRQIIAMVANFAVAIFEFIAFVMRFSNFGGFQELFLDISFWIGIIAIIGTVAMGIAQMHYIWQDKPVPHWAKELKLMAVGGIGFVLAMDLIREMGNGYYYFLAGRGLFTHFLCPFFAIVPYVVLEGRPDLGIGSVFKVVLPEIAYMITAFVFMYLDYLATGEQAIYNLLAAAGQMTAGAAGLFAGLALLNIVNNQIEYRLSRDL